MIKIKLILKRIAQILYHLFYIFPKKKLNFNSIFFFFLNKNY